MARIIKVTPEQLDSASKAISGMATDYKELYDLFYSKTAAMEASWKGTDNKAYIDRIDGFKDDFKRMYDLMNKYADFLQTSAKAYKDTQADIEKRASRLDN